MHKINYQSLFIKMDGTKAKMVIICQCGGNGHIDKDTNNELIIKCSNCYEILKLNDLE